MLCWSRICSFLFFPLPVLILLIEGKGPRWQGVPTISLNAGLEKEVRHTVSKITKIQEEMVCIKFSQFKSIRV
jgi:hypothetical protein